MENWEINLGEGMHNEVILFARGDREVGAGVEGRAARA